MPQQPRPGNDNSAAGVYGQATEYLLPSLSDDDTDDEQQSVLFFLRDTFDLI